MLNFEPRLRARLTASQQLPHRGFRACPPSARLSYKLTTQHIPTIKHYVIVVVTSLRCNYTRVCLCVCVCGPRSHVGLKAQRYTDHAGPRSNADTPLFFYTQQLSFALFSHVNTQSRRRPTLWQVPHTNF